jgi:hypothetical protein
VNDITPFGAWTLDFARSGQYRITLRTLPEEAPAAEASLRAGTARLWIGKDELVQNIQPGSRFVEFETQIKSGITPLETRIECDDQSIPAHGAFYVRIEYLGTL